MTLHTVCAKWLGLCEKEVRLMLVSSCWARAMPSWAVWQRAYGWWRVVFSHCVYVCVCLCACVCKCVMLSLRCQSPPCHCLGDVICLCVCEHEWLQPCDLRHSAKNEAPARLQGKGWKQRSDGDLTWFLSQGSRPSFLDGLVCFHTLRTD